MKQLHLLLQSKRAVLLTVLFALQLVFLVWLARGIVFKSYDILYWKDRFEHSQWQLPLSQRILGDDGLFEYVGYTLVHGADPSLVNAETPPVGKYLIGLSIVLFHNPQVYTFFVGIGAIVVFFFLCKRFLQSSFISLACTLVLFFDPLFYSQLFGGWVDSTQLFFLLFHFLLLFSLSKEKSWKQYALIAGSALSLGLFAESKTPILLPTVLLVDLLYLFRYSYAAMGIFLGAFVIGDVLPYAFYFKLHHSLGDFIRLQKYIIAFYAKSRLKIHHDAFWATIFLGKFPDIVSGVLGSVKEWWILWPIAFVVSSFQAIKVFVVREKSSEAKMVAVFLLFSVVVFSIIPFYPRYFLILLPFVYLFMFAFLKQFNRQTLGLVLITVVAVFGLVNAYLYFMPNPQDTVSAFSYNFSHGFFQDIYQEDLTHASQQTVGSRTDFFTITHTAFSQAEIRSVSVSAPKTHTSFFATAVTVPLAVTYYTQNLGTFTQKKELHLIKENGQWKVVWDWNLLLTNFVPGDTLETSVIDGKRGSISDGKGNILAQDTEGFLISVIPDMIDRSREQEMLGVFQKFSGQKAVHLQNAYLENSLPSEEVPVFTNFSDLLTVDQQLLASFPGVSFEPTVVRLYSNYPSDTIANTAYTECCSRIYSSWSYHGALGFEKQYDKVLSGYDGGSLLLIDKTGKTVQTIIQKEPKNGQDVSVSL